MDDEPFAYGALTDQNTSPRFNNFERRVAALQELYQQKQSELLVQFQQTRNQLALQHYQRSQQLVEEYLNERYVAIQQQSLAASVAAAASSTHSPTENMPSTSAFKNGIIPASSSPSSSSSKNAKYSPPSGTISSRTKKKLKALIHDKRRRQLSSTDSSPHFEPYPLINSDDHRLRKACSEPNLKTRSISAVKTMLFKQNSQNDAGSSFTSPAGGLLLPGVVEYPTSLFTSPATAPFMFSAPSLPSLPTQSLPSAEFVTSTSASSQDLDSFGGSGGRGSVDGAGGSNGSVSRFLSMPSLLSCSPSSWPSMPNISYLRSYESTMPDLPYMIMPQSSRGLRQLDRRNLTAPLQLNFYQHSLLRQQLRDLVLRRKSLVREETDDEVARERTNSPVSVLTPPLASTTSDTRSGSVSAVVASVDNWSSQDFTGRTGVSFDVLMAQHACICNNEQRHVENGGRIRSMWSHLKACGLLDKCLKIPCRKASLDYLRLCHDDYYTTFFGVSPTACMKIDPSRLPVRNFIQLQCGGIGVDADTYFNDGITQLAARVAVGCTVDLSLSVASGHVKNGFAIVRPPGHHAEPSQPFGFCFFNNVAVAARVLLSKVASVQKIAIVDWDVHHGNGTQTMFEAESNVLYLSLHRHDDGSFFPGTGAVTEVGQGAGSGFTVNVAWSGEMMGDAEYLAAWRSVVVHVLKQFQPDMVLVSAGFDAANGHCTALGGYHLSAEMFAYMTEKLSELCGRLVLVLEGGYDMKACNGAAEKCLRVLLDGTHFDLPEDSVKAVPNRSAQKTLQRVIDVHKKFWSSISDDGIAISQEAWDKQQMEMDDDDGSDESLCVVDVVSTNSPKPEWAVSAEHNGVVSSAE